MPESEDSIRWQEHVGNWTGIYHKRLVAAVNHHQDSTSGAWFWTVSLAGPGTKFAPRFQSADEAKEAVADYLGDYLAERMD